MEFRRSLNLERFSGSAFVFGPRMTGKTFLLRNVQADLRVDLLDPEVELDLRASPRRFWETLRAVRKGGRVIVDEVQRIPVLLDYVQKGIEELGLRFFLSGSSARKLRRGGANMLGGRAADLRLHPLCAQELGSAFQLERALRFGTLPRIAQLQATGDDAEIRSTLQAYVTTYIKEEIQAEALTRNIGAFARFLRIAAQCNAQVIEWQHIAREAAVPASTVKEYFSILEDTLIGRLVWPWDRSQRKKARPKFYFFDTGVARALQQDLGDSPSAIDRGHLFETWFLGELYCIRDYHQRDFEISLWREGPHEVDFVIERGGHPVLGIECKSGRTDISAHAVTAWKKQFPKAPLIVASPDARPRRLENGVDVLPISEALARAQGV